MFILKTEHYITHNSNNNNDIWSIFLYVYIQFFEGFDAVCLCVWDLVLYSIMYILVDEGTYYYQNEEFPLSGR